MIPFISINTLSLDRATLDADVAIVIRLGARGISPDLEDIERFGINASSRLLNDSQLVVVTLTHRAFGFATPAIESKQRDRLNRTIDIAAQIGAKSICMTSGGRGEYLWTDAAQRFCGAVQPCASRARDAGVALAIEPTSHLYAEASIVHRLTDTVSLARSAGIQVGIDLFACWFDADIQNALIEAAPLSAFVQVSDYVLGDRGLPCRAVPGDGALPLDKLVHGILGAGYQGAFDIEIVGPRLASEGRELGLKRGMERLQRALASMPSDKET